MFLRQQALDELLQQRAAQDYLWALAQHRAQKDRAGQTRKDLDIELNQQRFRMDHLFAHRFGAVHLLPNISLQKGYLLFQSPQQLLSFCPDEVLP